MFNSIKITIKNLCFYGLKHKGGKVMFVLTVNKKNTVKILAGLLAFAVLGFAGVKIKNSLFKDRETSASVNGGEMTTTSQMADNASRRLS